MNYSPDTVNSRQQKSVVTQATAQELGVGPQVMNYHFHSIHPKQLLGNENQEKFVIIKIWAVFSQ